MKEAHLSPSRDPCQGLFACVRMYAFTVEKSLPSVAFEIPVDRACCLDQRCLKSILRVVVIMPPALSSLLLKLLRAIHVSI